MVALPEPYEQKFAGFIKSLEEKADVLLVHHPEVLGDTYEELVESLNRLADAGKMLSILPRKERS
jgi:predicted oxidoreductase